MGDAQEAVGTALEDAINMALWDPGTTRYQPLVPLRSFWQVRPEAGPWMWGWGPETRPVMAPEWGLLPGTALAFL